MSSISHFEYDLDKHIMLITPCDCEEACQKAYQPSIVCWIDDEENNFFTFEDSVADEPAAWDPRYVKTFGVFFDYDYRDEEDEEDD